MRGSSVSGLNAAEAKGRNSRWRLCVVVQSDV